MSRIAVIGGGIGGLAGAALLAKEGHEVTLLEMRDTVGGRAGSWSSDGFRFDTGPSWYLMPEVFDHFYKLLGTSAEEQLNLVTLDPGYRVMFEGGLPSLDIAVERDDNVALFESVEKGAGAKLDAYLDSASEVYELAKKYFLYSTFDDLRPLMTKEVVSRGGRFVKLLRQPLAGLVNRTVKDPRLRQILGYPAVFLGSEPYSTPSMYHLMSHLDMDDGVLYPMGGFAHLIETIERLARAQGVTVITGAEATRIRTSAKRATGVDYRTADGEHTIDADVVVSGADLHHTETQLLGGGERTFPERYWKKKVAGPGAVLLYLGIRGELPELEHHTLLFAKDWKGGFRKIFSKKKFAVPEPASLYICKPSGVDPSVAPEGHENVFVLVPAPAEPSLGGRGDANIEAIADRVITQISEWANIPDLADRIVVRRTVGPADFERELHSWRGTALGPSHILKQSAFFRAGNKSTKVKGLYYVGGSTIPGIGLPMCLISAELLVKRLRGDVSPGPLPEPLKPSAR